MSSFTQDCPANTWVTGFYGAVGSWVDSMGIVCSDGSYKVPAGNTAYGTSPTMLPGGKTNCPEGYSGATTSTGSYFDNIVGQCGSTTQRFGNGNGPNHQFPCPAGQVVTGITGTQDRYVNYVDVKCGAKPAPVQAVSATTVGSTGPGSGTGTGMSGTGTGTGMSGTGTGTGILGTGSAMSGSGSGTGVSGSGSGAGVSGSGSGTGISESGSGTAISGSRTATATGSGSFITKAVETAVVKGKSFFTLSHILSIILSLILSSVIVVFVIKRKK